ncbi:uncharacterized protein LOC142024817 isoform X2 [Carettochelys insculpta]
MMTEAESTLTETELRSSQAINEDYEDTSYDRGHLNPNSFQCDYSRTATFTLTNAAPMDTCFNWKRWYKLEKSLKAQLTQNCSNVGGVPYLVTGTVPNPNVKIPMQVQHKEWDRYRPYNQVSVPSHVWTAVCCKHAFSNQTFSFAFLAENKEESSLKDLSVKQLNTELSGLYGASEPIQIFTDECGSDTQKKWKVLSAVKSDLFNTFRNLLSDSYSQLLPPAEKNKLDSETTRLMSSKNLNQSNLQLTNIGFLVKFPTREDWHRQFEETYDQDGLACVLAPAAAAGVGNASGQVCALQEKKHGLDSRVTAKGWSCVGKPCGKHDSAYSWCYTSYSNNWDYCCTDKCSVNPNSRKYECARGDGTATECSPQYSAATVSGKACRADHPCGLYNKSYFWCYTDYRDNWEYCCSPQHFCGDHDKDHLWCYTRDPEKSWEYCTL